MIQLTDDQLAIVKSNALAAMNDKALELGEDMIEDDELDENEEAMLDTLVKSVVETVNSFTPATFAGVALNPPGSVFAL